MKNLQLKLCGQPGEIDAAALAKALDHTVRLLRSVSEDPIDCKIGELRVGSACVGVLAPEGKVDSVLDGLERLENGGALPDEWGSSSIEAVLEIGKITRDQGVTDVSLGAKGGRMYVLEHRLLDNARATLRERDDAMTSYGSVSGRLYSYARRKEEVKARLEDARTKASVQLDVPLELQEQARVHVDRNVTIWGRLSRSSDTNAVVRVEVLGIEPVENPSQGKDPSRFMGVLKDFWPSDLDPVEAVREFRG